MTAKKIPTKAKKPSTFDAIAQARKNGAEIANRTEKAGIARLAPLSNAIAEFAEARRNAQFPASKVKESAFDANFARAARRSAENMKAFGNPNPTPAQRRTETKAAKIGLRMEAEAAQAKSGLPKTRGKLKDPQHMTKKEVMGLNAGTWIELWWRDAPNTVSLLLDRPEPGLGEISLHCLHFSEDASITPTRDRHAVNTQVVCVVGRLQSPFLV